MLDLLTSLAPPAVLAVAALGINFIQIRMNRREVEEHGRRRQAREDHRDPDPAEPAGTAAREDGAGTGDGPGGTASPGVITITGPDGKTAGWTTAGALVAAMKPMREPEVPPKPEVPVERQDQPILAHRAAQLQFNGVGHPFGSIMSSVVSGYSGFGVDSSARCVRGDFYSVLRKPPHGNVPKVGCSCGFYALPTDMRQTYQNKSYVNLQVELYGKVIVCEKGYRAEFQRVVECQLPPCPYCGSEAEVLHVLNNIMIEATCLNHQGEWGQQVTENGGHIVKVLIADLELPVAMTRQGR